QALFKNILLITVGVLMVVLMRILIGIKTSGTFMPVLIALAFIQTSLVTGLVGFLLIVGAGLIIRSYLSHLNLLLVARISAVIIMVIGMIALFSIIAFKVGLTEGMKITFFPMIILAWTIERMSILWEEEGAKQVMVQGGGSLAVAIIAFLVMNNDLVRHLTFNFLGIQLILMAITLMAGSYTGYRLLELKRFKPLTEIEKP
ncbi:MAG: 7TM domain-containing protein, partial [Methylophaga sp.]